MTAQLLNTRKFRNHILRFLSQSAQIWTLLGQINKMFQILFTEYNFCHNFALNYRFFFFFFLNDDLQINNVKKWQVFKKINNIIKIKVIVYKKTPNTILKRIILWPRVKSMNINKLEKLLM